MAGECLIRLAYSLYRFVLFHINSLERMKLIFGQFPILQFFLLELVIDSYRIRVIFGGLFILAQKEFHISLQIIMLDHMVIA